mmetsp:Transcript_30700/g.81626  ORF Transcript_30700/g.81626 Transcript_30700/m.81626 type:complete len:223 (+) Transcript_30700:192-860(+)
MMLTKNLVVTECRPLLRPQGVLDQCREFQRESGHHILSAHNEHQAPSTGQCGSLFGRAMTASQEKRISLRPKMREESAGPPGVRRQRHPMTTAQPKICVPPAQQHDRARQYLHSNGEGHLACPCDSPCFDPNQVYLVARSSRGTSPAWSWSPRHQSRTFPFHRSPLQHDRSNVVQDSSRPSMPSQGHLVRRKPQCSKAQLQPILAHLSSTCRWPATYQYESP